MSQWPPSECEQWELLNFVVAGLNWHRKSTDRTWVDVLNRLPRKQEFFDNASGDRIHRDDIPRMDQENITVSAELWSLDRIIAARRGKPHDRDNPKCDHCPFIVIELAGNHYLLDGGTRTNRRIRDCDHGPHRVVVVHTSDI